MSATTTRENRRADGIAVFGDYTMRREDILAVARDHWIMYELGWLESDRLMFKTEEACLDYALASGRFASVLIMHVGHEAYMQPLVNGTAITAYP